MVRYDMVTMISRFHTWTFELDATDASSLEAIRVEEPFPLSVAWTRRALDCLDCLERMGAMSYC